MVLQDLLITLDSINAVGDSQQTGFKQKQPEGGSSIMIQGTKIKKLLASGQSMDRVTVNGWVRQKRASKGVIFLELNDGSVIRGLQIVVDEDSPAFENAEGLQLGASIRADGPLVESPGAGQSVEMQADTITVYGSCDESYPLQKKRHSNEFLRTIAHLRPRTNTFGAVFRVRSEAAFAVHEFFQERGFYCIHTPVITGSDAEGAGEMFQVTTLPLNRIPLTKDHQGNMVPDFTRDFFKQKTGLTVSGQLEGEMFALALSEIYTFGPTFRAENSNTPRHVAEFWMIEPEMAFYDLEDTIVLAEEFIKQVTSRVMERCPEEMTFFCKWIDKTLESRLSQVVNTPFETISYSEAIAILKKASCTFEYPVHWGMDLQTEHERFLTEQSLKKPVFVVDYPQEIKAFYMRQNDDGKTMAAMDLLVPQIGEVIGGSQREERTDQLEEMIRRKKLDQADYWWYLDARRFGTAPHAGFGLGFARLLLYLTGMANIRDVMPFPRTPGNAQF
jgi:asparaginyl-tRNA synthetase